MGFFQKFFSSTAPSVEQPKSTGYQAFSTPLMHIGSENLALPQIQTNYSMQGYIYFGTDNLYPQKLTSLYSTSGMHGACVDFVVEATIGGGYEWENTKLTATEKVNLLAFEKANSFKKLFRILSLDYYIHRRVTVELTKRQGTYKFKRIDPASIRSNATGTKFMYSEDWSRGLINAKEYDVYTEDKNDGVYLYVYHALTPGTDVYPLPRYNGILNWAYLDAENPFFHKSNLQNSIFPSIVIRRPKEFGSEEEVRKFKTEISTKTGAKNAGRVLVLTGNGKEAVPELDQLTANKNDEAFSVSAKESKESICIAHRVNPAIMGIKVAGSLGTTTEIKDAYTIFEKGVVLPLRAELEEIFNDLVSLANVPNTLKIKNFQIIDNIITEKL